MNLPHHSKSFSHPGRPQPFESPARTMLEVDFQVGLRRDSWPSLPRDRSSSLRDFHMGSLKKMSGSSQQISPDFWKLSEIENFQSSKVVVSKHHFSHYPMSNCFLNGSSFFWVQNFRSVAKPRHTKHGEGGGPMPCAPGANSLELRKKKTMNNSLVLWLIDRDPCHGLL